MNIIQRILRFTDPDKFKEKEPEIRVGDIWIGQVFNNPRHRVKVLEIREGWVCYDKNSCQLHSSQESVFRHLYTPETPETMDRQFREGSFQKYTERLEALHDLIGQGKGDTEKADDIREEMDCLWKNLSDEEKRKSMMVSVKLWEDSL